MDISVRSESSLDSRIQFETLVADLAARLAVAPPGMVLAEVHGAIDAMRRFFRADRCGLLAVDSRSSAVSVLVASYAEGISGPSRGLNLGAMFPWARYRLVVEKQPVVMSRLADLPPEAAVDRASWEAMPTRSSLIVPLGTESSSVVNLMLVAAVRQEVAWSPEYVPRLRVFGEVLLNSLAREESALREREQATRVAAAADTAGLGFSSWVVGTTEPQIDDRMCELLGLDGVEPARIQEVWLGRIDAGSMPDILEKRRQLLECEIDHMTVEYRYEHPCRGSIWLRHSSRRMSSRDGDGPLLVGAVEDVTDRVRALEEARRLRERLERENAYLKQETARRLGPERIVGRCGAIRDTLALADRVAPTDSTVLLHGETGTGKERLAAYIHEASRRRDRTMIRVNCAAIPTTLIESELFGREKGAYTGALSKQIGRFELANGSTLFLDEIGELPMEVQVKLLRVLEARTIERLGNPKPVPVDVRIIVATHRDLAREVREGRFREDLYYRLNVFPIRVPPLRERAADIPLLVEAFVEELSATMGKRIDEVDPASIDTLVAHAWPGNVRELRNAVEHAMIMATDPVLRIEAPRVEGRTAPSGTELTSVERSHIEKVLSETGWRIRGAHGAASRLGMKPTTLESRMKKLGLSRPGMGDRMN